MHHKIEQCIYCNTKEHKLTNEHVIPFALSGELILKKASCSQCQKIINKYETRLSREVYKRTRIQLKLPSRHNNLDYCGDTVTFFDKTGEYIEKYVKTEDLPKAFLTLKIPEPKILTGRKEDVATIDIAAHDINGELQKSLRSNETRVHLGRIRIFDFVRSIAKIAHGYAIAVYGVNTFKPLLLDLILSKSQEYQHIIGTSLEKPLRDPQNLHKLMSSEIERESCKYLVVKVQLFCLLGAPIYTVVVGELEPS